MAGNVYYQTNAYSEHYQTKPILIELCISAMAHNDALDLATAAVQAQERFHLFIKQNRDAYSREGLSVLCQLLNTILYYSHWEGWNFVNFQGNFNGPILNMAIV